MTESQKGYILYYCPCWKQCKNGIRKCFHAEWERQKHFSLSLSLTYTNCITHTQEVVVYFYTMSQMSESGWWWSSCWWKSRNFLVIVYIAFIYFLFNSKHIYLSVLSCSWISQSYRSYRYSCGTTGFYCKLLCCMFIVLYCIVYAHHFAFLSFLLSE